jgi:RNA polymerase sigma-70 factor, ECF subfamily
LAATVECVTSPRLPDDFERVFRENYELVFRAAYSITNSPEDAEDVLQSLFEKLLRRNNLSDVEKNPKGYLYRAAINAALDVSRARRPLDFGDKVDRQTADTARSRLEDIQEWLSRALQKMNAREAQIFVLRHVEGYTNAEIAKLLETSRGTVAVSLFRGRAYLKRSMKRHFGDSL